MGVEARGYPISSMKSGLGCGFHAAPDTPSRTSDSDSTLIRYTHSTSIRTAIPRHIRTNLPSRQLTGLKPYPRPLFRSEGVYVSVYPCVKSERCLALKYDCGPVRPQESPALCVVIAHAGDYLSRLPQRPDWPGPCRDAGAGAQFVPTSPTVPNEQRSKCPTGAGCTPSSRRPA